MADRADEAMVAAIRAFNRVVTQRVGALNDHFLARDRPLGEARVLWEIGEQGCEVRVLRARLALDSGYLSRLLRSLEHDGLITMQTRADDQRVRTTRLTKQGKAERRLLDRRSDALARSIIAPLNASERERFVAATTEVSALLTRALLRIDVVDPTHPHAQHCLREYFADLDRRFHSGFDPARTRPADPDEMRPPAGVFLVATLRDEPIGCGGLKFHGTEPTELKRMWVSPSARGLGVGKRLLIELERRAAERNPVVRLDTNRALTEAISMYRAAGYKEIKPFNDERYADYWFEKRLRRRKTR